MGEYRALGFSRPSSTFVRHGSPFSNLMNVLLLQEATINDTINETINISYPYVQPYQPNKLVSTISSIAGKTESFLGSVGNTISPQYPILAVLLILLIIYIFVFKNR